MWWHHKAVNIFQKNPSPACHTFIKTISRMQPMGTTHYVNERPSHGRKRREKDNHRDRKLCQLLLLSFAMQCIIQAALNVSLRLTLYSSRESPDCNATHVSDHKQPKQEQMDCEQKRKEQFSRLHDELNRLTADNRRLENQNNDLNNRLQNVQEELDRLKLRVPELGGCKHPFPCQPGWRNINSRCYFLSTEMKTWKDSRTYCQSQGADLVVINSQQEQSALYQLDGKPCLLFWIGLYYTYSFNWVDGSALVNAYWKSDQPDRGGPNNREDCVEMYHGDPRMANWNDAPCGAKRRWLCEKDSRPC